MSIRSNLQKASKKREHTSTTAGITPANLCAEIYVAWSIYQVQQVVVPLVIVQHATCLCFHSDSPFTLDIKLVEDLLVSTGLYGARELEEAIAEG